MDSKPIAFQFPGLIIYEDGSTTRSPSSAFPEVPANPEFVDGVASRDIVVDESLGIWVRVFLPESLAEKKLKVPVVIFFHGGGFLVASASLLAYHRWCSQVATTLPAVVVSVNYRLAPENRLPAAYEDGTQVLLWLRDVVAKGDADSVCNYFRAADFSKVILMGDSAGGNIAHHVAITCSDMFPLKLVGLVALYPFFGGVSRVESEEKFATAPALTLDASDVCWKWSLPVGSDRDHPFSNVGLHLTNSPESLAAGFPSTFVVVAGQDVVRDRAVEYARILEAAGKCVKLAEYEDVPHGFLTPELIPQGGEQASQAGQFFGELAAFLDVCCA